MDGLVPIQGDRAQLQQVVVNLILNAVDGVRELSTTVAPTKARQVASSSQCAIRGPGIDLGNLERVFEPFYTTKTTEVGMGLSICRSITNSHGGKLWVAPNEPRGAQFQFTLPAAQEDS
jgi:signal transduction histidine kinase